MEILQEPNNKINNPPRINMKHSRLFFLFAFLPVVGLSSSIAQFAGKQSEWKGFKKTVFKVGEHEAFVVEPEEPAKEAPWVWRARFPTYHTEIDEMLLRDGYHVAHINAGSRLGSPNALKIWKQFYDLLTEKHGLNKKLVLEGVSRGGLYVYRWAKAYPETVACIYNDTPVCDFKSWPGGKGAGKGAQGQWNRVIEEYGFKNEEEAMAYRDNPIDNLQPIVDARIPIMHIITEDDAIVPPKENTYVLKERLEKLGHPFFYVISIDKGNRANGHHFDVKYPHVGYHFIRKYSDFSNEYPIYLRSGLNNSRLVFTKKKKGRVGFLGGSITESPGWRLHVSDSLKKRFPQTEFDFVYAGIGSTDSTYGAFRLGRDILSKGKVDLLFIESAVNELHNSRTRDDIVKAVEGIVLQSRRHNPHIDIVAQYLYDMPYVESYRKGITPWQIAALDRISLQYGINAIDQARQVTKWFDSGEIPSQQFGGCHPKPVGHKAYGEMIDRLFDQAWNDSIAQSLNPHIGGRRYDEYSYDHGHFQSIKTVKIKNGWKVVKNWQGTGKGRVRKHDVGIDYMEALVPGAELAVEFSGTAIGLPMVAGPDVGIIEWKVDDREWKSLDQFTKWSKGLHIPWIYMLEKELPAGKHLLTLRTTDRKNDQSKGYACRFSSFAVNGN
jgi:hypothetical protein